MTQPLPLREKLAELALREETQPEEVMEALFGLKPSPGQRILITLDGPCASGKTTAAEALAKALGASVLHTDDFVVPHAQKTPVRLAVPGGNCYWERLSQVISQWKAGLSPAYQRYDCRHDCFLPPENLASDRILILEGSYCNLPGLRKYADLRLFMDTPEPERLERLRRREPPDSLRMFFSKWIPLENAYFAAYGLPDEQCVVIR